MAVQTVAEKINERFKEFSQKLLDDFGEVANLMLVVDWTIGKREFPTGFMAGRSDNLCVETLAGLLVQMARANVRLNQAYVEQIQAIEKGLLEKTNANSTSGPT